MSEKSDLHLCR